MQASLGLGAAFLLGLAGSLAHCASMCGPIAFAIHRPRGGGVQPRRIAAYQTGRIVTYTGIGVVAGASGSLLNLAGNGLHLMQEIAALLGAALMLFAGASLLLQGKAGFEGLIGTGWLMRRVSPLFGKSDWLSTLMLGLLLGFLPCGLVYSAASYAIVAGHPVAGGATMFAFGLGTVPALVGTTFLGTRLQGWGRRMTQISGIVLVVSGAFYAWKGFPG